MARVRSSKQVLMSMDDQKNKREFSASKQQYMIMMNSATNQSPRNKRLAISTSVACYRDGDRQL